MNRCSQVTDESVKLFGEVLKRLPLLRSVDLSFGTLNGRGIADESLRVFGEGLQRLVSLKEISLLAGNCERLTDKGVQMFCGALKRLGCLQSIRLGFIR